MDDIRSAIREDDTRSMTYAEIAEARGISANSAERLVRRRRWAKRPGNDGTIRVLVPPDEARPANVRNPGRRPAGRPSLDILPAIRDAIREAIQPIREQLDRERDRADKAEARADSLQARLDARRWWRWWRG